jgi:hypothetical protein
LNILVLGNGFDIAHNLKTQYKDFLEAVEITHELINSEKAFRVKRWNTYNKSKISQCLIDVLDEIVKTKTHETDELNVFHTYYSNNFWFKYFMDKPKGTWIDFERDIKEVCKFIENKISSKGSIRKLNDDINLNDEFSDYIKYIKNKDEIKTYAKLIEKLEEDLKHVINSLDIYINEFVNMQECEEISPDIISLDIDRVISFNYSITYQRLYNITPDIPCDYIHGKAGIGRNKDYSNLVLGYDESKEKVNEETISIFASFKKYYQRVLKGTGNQYFNWIKDIKDNPKKEHKVYFFGHSMDVTDSDIIKALILNSNVKTTIFYYSNLDKMDKVKNLISVLGYEHFVEYTSSGSVEFIEQKPFKKKQNAPKYRSKMTIKYLYDLPNIPEWKYCIIKDWFEKIKLNHYFYELKYFYLAIDALQKYSVEPDKVTMLIELCKKHNREPCKFDDFLKDYSLYCGKETKFENVELEKLIKSIYENRVEDKKNEYYIFLEKIKFDKRILNAIYLGNQGLVINDKKLSRVFDCFLDSFDKFLSYPEIYDDMVKLLLLIDSDIVSGIFFDKLIDTNLSDVKNNRIQILQNKYLGFI